MAAVANAASTCKPWCTNHDHDGDVCNDAGINLDFKAGCLSVDTATFADVSLSYCAEEDVTVWLGLPRLGSTHFELEHARQLAEAILEKVRQAEAATRVPGPRGSAEGGVK